MEAALLSESCMGGRLLVLSSYIGVTALGESAMEAAVEEAIFVPKLNFRELRC
jgi:hypothetical protein